MISRKTVTLLSLIFLLGACDGKPIVLWTWTSDEPLECLPKEPERLQELNAKQASQGGSLLVEEYHELRALECAHLRQTAAACGFKLLPEAEDMACKSNDTSQL